LVVARRVLTLDSVTTLERSARADEGLSVARFRGEHKAAAAIAKDAQRQPPREAEERRIKSRGTDKQ
jgi:hypothetical protein